MFFRTSSGYFRKLAENPGIDQIFYLISRPLGKGRMSYNELFIHQIFYFLIFYHHQWKESANGCWSKSYEVGMAYCQLHNVEFTRLSKIDVEGLNQKCFLVLDRMFARKRIGNVQFEYGDWC